MASLDAQAPLPSNPSQGGCDAPHIQPCIGGGLSQVTKNAPSQTSDADADTHFGHRVDPISGGPVTKSVPQEGF